MEKLIINVLGNHEVLMKFENLDEMMDFLKWWNYSGKDDFNNREYNEDGTYDPTVEYED